MDAIYDIHTTPASGIFWNIMCEQLGAPVEASSVPESANVNAVQRTDFAADADAE